MIISIPLFIVSLIQDKVENKYLINNLKSRHRAVMVKPGVKKKDCPICKPMKIRPADRNELT